MSGFFVTGASGFIGRALVDQLTAAGHDVRGMDLRGDDRRRIVAGDVLAERSSSQGDWAQQIAAGDTVIHTAALVSNTPTADEAWRVSALGTRRVIDAAVAAGARRLIYLSSIRAFSDLGFPDGVTEDHPVRTDGNPYVDARVCAEQVVLQAHAAGQIAATVIRPGDVYGPGCRVWITIPLETIRAGLFLLPAMGQGVFSPVYIDDLVAAIGAAAAREAAAGQVFTVTGGVGVSCAEFFAHHHRWLGRSGPRCVPTPVAVALAAGAERAARLAGRSTELNPTAVRYFARTGTYSIDKARSMLDYRPAVGLDEGMERTRRRLVDQGLLPKEGPRDVPWSG